MSSPPSSEAGFRKPGSAGGAQHKKRPSTSEEKEKEFNAILNSTDPHIVEIKKKVTEVLTIFDSGGKKMIDVREVGSIVRALELYPTESEVQDIIQHVEETSGQGQVRFEKLMSYITKIILNGDKYRPIPYEQVANALKSLDREKSGLLDPKKVKELMMKEGEPFSSEEADEMLSTAVNHESGKIVIDEFAAKLCSAKVDIDEQ